MYRSLAALVSILALGVPLAGGAQPQKPLEPCALFDSGVMAGQPIVQRGPFKRAFSLYRAEKWRPALRAFEENMNRIAQLVADHFHPPEGRDVSNERIQRFLTGYVLGRDPVLVVTEDDFRFVAPIYLAVAESRCRLGDAAGAEEALSGVSDEDHPRLPLARAVIALTGGQAEAALSHLGEDRATDDLRVRLARTLALSAAGRAEEAWASLDRARAQCAGPVECGLAEAARASLLDQADRERQR